MRYLRQVSRTVSHRLSYRVIESLRLEKGYRAWGSDITPNDTPFEAGLGWAVKLKSNIDFLGRAASEQFASQSSEEAIGRFPPSMIHRLCWFGRETILRDGVPVGYLTSAGYGYTVSRPNWLRLRAETQMV